MPVHSYEQLDDLELRIRMFLVYQHLDRVLLGLRAQEGNGRIPRHVLAAAACFAMRFGTAGLGLPPSGGPLTLQELDPLLALVGEYVHADPVTFDATVPNSFLSI